ncbi:helix-turn-helix domain-containing protein [Amycolatopsis nigrescens]|uniref:helix-turn-helix domain-containing protein n=1 Tax=Amycolatopsis nigrescens TaxID=381445 RepID=UPI000379C418|nr:helix-turn-helix transcriptional regulator [Amycolatopsis nigrescens]
MTSSKQATVSGRGLGGELRLLRQDRGKTGVEVATVLGWQPSKLSRIETGQQGISVADTASILVIYSVIGQERDRLLKMAERSGQEGWWDSHTSLSKESKTLIQLESDATAIFTFHPLLVPGLLQTPDYIRAVMEACRISKQDIDARVAARMGRQMILSRHNPPGFEVIVDEMVLRRVLGDPKIMVRQLRHLIESTERANFSLRVLPLSLGGHPGLDGSFHFLDFEKAKPVVYLDHKISGLFLEESSEVAFYRGEMDKLRQVALNSSESIDLVASVAQEHDQE